MNRKVKSLWVAALLSDEYKQTQGELRNNKGYCCLGVLCDLHSKATGLKWETNSYGDFVYGADEQGMDLPFEVISWAGLASHNPAISHSLVGLSNLGNINDTGYVFKVIAELIEQQL